MCLAMLKCISNIWDIILHCKLRDVCKEACQFISFFQWNIKAGQQLWDESQKLARDGWKAEDFRSLAIVKYSGLWEMDFVKGMERLAQHKHYLVSCICPETMCTLKPQMQSFMLLTCFVSRKPSVLWIYCFSPIKLAVWLDKEGNSS